MLAEPSANPPSQAFTWAQMQKELPGLIVTASVITLLWLIVAVLLFRRSQLRWSRIWPRQHFFALAWSPFQVILLWLFGIVVSSLAMQLQFWPAGWELFRYVQAMAIEAAVFVLVPIGVLQVPAYQIGLAWSRWREDVVLSALLGIPALGMTWTIWLAMVLLAPVSEHKLVQEWQQSASWPNWCALALTAVVLAPLAEEVLFRGLILRTMAAEPFWADLTMLLALVSAIVQGYGATTWGPVLFLVSVGPGYLAFEWLSRRILPRPGLARAVYASSLIFAAVHAEAWPAPVPLFFFSLILGTAAARTQTLLAPWLMHAAFNATTVLALLEQ